jgi:hypothetical protein
MARARCRRCDLSKTRTSWPRWRNHRADKPVCAERLAAVLRRLCGRKPRPAGPRQCQARAQGRAAAGGQHRPGHVWQDDNALLLVDAQGASEMPHASKRVLASKLIAEIARRTLGWVHKQ